MHSYNPALSKIDLARKTIAGLALCALSFSIPAAVMFFNTIVYPILSILGLFIQIYMAVACLASDDRHKYPKCFSKCAIISILIFDLLLVGFAISLDVLFDTILDT